METSPFLCVLTENKAPSNNCMSLSTQDGPQQHDIKQWHIFMAHGVYTQWSVKNVAVYNFVQSYHIPFLSCLDIFSSWRNSACNSGKIVGHFWDTVYKAVHVYICMYVHLQLGNEKSNCLQIFRVAAGRLRDGFRCQKIRVEVLGRRRR